MKKHSIFFTIFFLLLLVSCSEKITSYSRTIFSMNTYITLTVYSNSNSNAQIVLDNLDDIYTEYSKLADSYMEYSNITNVCSLNKNREGIVCNNLLNLIKYSLKMKDETNGYFNPLMGSLNQMWKDSLFAENCTPKPLSLDIVEAELNKIDESEIVIDNNSIKILGSALIDLGGIAKGYATEECFNYLKENNIEHYLINAGSSNVCVGTKKGDYFSVGLKKINSKGYYKVLSVKDRAIVTSSLREQHVTINDKIYHHIINPMNGYPMDYYDLITLIGENSALLDAYSTALYSMSLDEIKDFISIKNIDIIIYKDDILLYQSHDGDNYEKNKV